MGFDIEKFRQAQFESRTKEIQAEALKVFFGKDEKPVFKIRNLTAEELAKVRDSVQRKKDIDSVVNLLASQGAKSKADGIKKALGWDDHPDDFVRRLTIMEIGTVDPRLERDVCVKISEVNSMLFQKITDEIMLLSGEGQKLGEPNASGTTRKSARR